MSIFEINQSITDLIESRGHNEAARNAVAALVHDLPGPAYTLTITRSAPDEPNVFLGDTGYGTQIGADDPEGKPKIKRWTSQEPRRIGDYKLHKSKPRRDGIDIIINRFWASDETTKVEEGPVQRWMLSLDKGFNPKWFGEIAERERHCDLWVLEIMRPLHNAFLILRRPEKARLLLSAPQFAVFC